MYGNIRYSPRSSSLGKEVFAMGTIPSNTPSLLPFDPSYTAAQIRDILDREANVNERTLRTDRHPIADGVILTEKAY